MFNHAEAMMIIERQKAEMERLGENNEYLKALVKDMSDKVAFTGLTTEELQGIHGLIQGQIALISSLQTSDDVLKVHSAVTPLALLVSLVSKPTD
jgi:hypothetical protein